MSARLAVTVVLLVVAALASDRFQLGVVPQPSAWLQQLPTPSLVSCAARCRQLSGCQLLDWHHGTCRLAVGDGVTMATEAPQIAMYRHSTLLVSGAPDPTATSSTTEETTSGQESTETTEDSTATTATTEISTSTTDETPTTTTASIIQTTTVPTTVSPCPPDFTLVDGHCYYHVTTDSPVNFDGARAMCASLASGGDLGGLYTPLHLEFFEQHPSRPNTQQWIGLKVPFGSTEFKNLLDNSRPAIPNFSDLLEGSLINIQLSLPADLTTGTLLRTAASTELSAAVCEAPMV